MYSRKVRCWSLECLSTLTDWTQGVVAAAAQLQGSAERRRSAPDQRFIARHRQPYLRRRLHRLPLPHAVSRWLRRGRWPAPAASRKCRKRWNSKLGCWRPSWDARRKSQQLQHWPRRQLTTTNARRTAKMTEPSQLDLPLEDQLLAFRRPNSCVSLYQHCHCLSVTVRDCSLFLALNSLWKLFSGSSAVHSIFDIVWLDACDVILLWVTLFVFFNCTNNDLTLREKFVI